MEPFDYPDNDPGPQTLLTTLGPEQTSTGCYWHLSRFQGYAGMPISWARASSPPMRVCSRSSARPPSGARLSRPTARRRAASRPHGGGPVDAFAGPYRDRCGADGGGDPPGAGKAGRSGERPRNRGRYPSALPISIERIGIWVRTLESRGIILVPLTTTMLNQIHAKYQPAGDPALGLVSGRPYDAERL